MPNPTLAPERMQCMEIWGGNQEIRKHFTAPGLDIFVESRPFLDSESGGGDIYYLTSCASGRISRFLLADVSGHGKGAAELAISLRDLMRRNVNKISQEKFVKEINLEFGDLAQAKGFATAVIATFFEPTKSLSVSIAGHPYPLYFHHDKAEWTLIDSALMNGKLENLPFGVHEGSDYPNVKLPTKVGDMFLLYTDAFVEAEDADGKALGIKDLLKLLNENPSLKAEEVIPYIQKRLKDLSDSNLLNDDATAIVGCFTENRPGWKNQLLAPFRLFKSVTDRTKLE